MADLALAEKPVHFIHRKSEHDLPDDMRGLFRRIRRVRRGAGIIPKSMVNSIQASLSLMDDLIEKEFSYDVNIWGCDDVGDDVEHNCEDGPRIHWDVEYEHQVLQRVAARTEQSVAENVSEPTWNARVHEPLLDVALTPFRDVLSHWDVTKASMDKAFLPRHASGIDLESKMVDFAIVLDGKDTKNAVIERLRRHTAGNGHGQIHQSHRLPAPTLSSYRCQHRDQDT